MGASAIVYTMVLQPDGKVVVGGYFNGLGGGTGATVRNYIGRTQRRRHRRCRLQSGAIVASSTRWRFRRTE